MQKFIICYYDELGYSEYYIKISPYTLPNYFLTANGNETMVQVSLIV